MANKKKSLRVAYDGGVDAYGKKKVRTRTYNDLVPEVEDTALLGVVGMLDSLTKEASLYAESITVNRLSE
ncbi:MAG: DUF1659 domain-containing protein [Peptoniphilus sp.]|nr:DUF1659 domain-containing protein [Peptoniphilus sp.]MDY6045085.1 DUF1659 domain-containing protein [Peptoniphilus sp.]